MRYQVKLYYRKWDGTDAPYIWTRHRSLKAAHRSLTSVISGKASIAAAARLGYVTRYLIADCDTGEEWSWRAARALAASTGPSSPVPSGQDEPEAEGFISTMRRAALDGSREAINQLANMAYAGFDLAASVDVNPCRWQSERLRVLDAAMHRYRARTKLPAGFARITKP